MPPVAGAVYLIEHLFEVGPVSAGGMGPAWITNEELLAWQINSRTRLAPWECKFLLRLSREYVGEGRKAEKINAKPPWTAPEVKAIPSDTQRALRALAAL